jgi:hypothetical protein
MLDTVGYWRGSTAEIVACKPIALKVRGLNPRVTSRELLQFKIFDSWFKG